MVNPIHVCSTHVKLYSASFTCNSCSPQDYLHKLVGGEYFVLITFLSKLTSEFVTWISANLNVIFFIIKIHWYIKNCLLLTTKHCCSYKLKHSLWFSKVISIYTNLSSALVNAWKVPGYFEYLTKKKLLSSLDFSNKSEDNLREYCIKVNLINTKSIQNVSFWISWELAMWPW